MKSQSRSSLGMGKQSLDANLSWPVVGCAWCSEKPTPTTFFKNSLKPGGSSSLEHCERRAAKQNKICSRKGGGGMKVTM